MEKIRKQIGGQSVVIISPKRFFLDWLSVAAASDPGQRPVEQVYNDVDATAWVMPRVESFDSHEEVCAFVSARKPAMLLYEVMRVYKGEDLFKHPFTEEVFDRCFDIRVIPTLAEIEKLDSTVFP